ncbi:MAG: DNA cytosine methyltransferase [Thermoproteota archaeon]
MFKLVSLFSGAGGLDLGFKLAEGFDLLFANEILDPPCRTYSKIFNAKIISSKEISRYAPFALNSTPAIYNLLSLTAKEKSPFIINGSIEEIDFSSLPFDYSDVVLGGPPCQDFSIIRGKDERKGIDVKRGQLYSYFIKALVKLQPKIFVFENVPGLKSANSGYAYKTITDDFQKLNLRWSNIRKIVGNGAKENKIEGYSLIFNDIVDFSKLGVPQIRKRLIIIGLRNDLIENDFEISEIQNKVKLILEGSKKLFRLFPMTPIEVFEGKTLPELNDSYRAVMNDYSNLCEQNLTKMAENWKINVWNRLKLDIVEDYLFFNSINKKDFNDSFEHALKEHEEVLRKLGYYGVPVSENDEFIESSEVLKRLFLIPPGGNYEFVKGTEYEVKALMSNIYRRLNPLVPSPAVIAYGGGGTWGYHYKRSRGKLTNKERARLQTFPLNVDFSGSTQEVRAQIGEAVPPIGAYNIALAVKEILKIIK